MTLGGLWILSPRWAIDSMKAGYVLPEEAYEIPGFAKMIEPDAPRRLIPSLPCLLTFSRSHSYSHIPLSSPSHALMHLFFISSRSHPLTFALVIDSFFNPLSLSPPPPSFSSPPPLSPSSLIPPPPPHNHSLRKGEGSYHRCHTKSYPCLCPQTTTSRL